MNFASAHSAFIEPLLPLVREPDEAVALVSDLVMTSTEAAVVATDLEGRVIWYLRSPDGITRVIPGGRFLVGADGSRSWLRGWLNPSARRQREYTYGALWGSGRLETPTIPVGRRASAGPN